MSSDKTTVSNSTEIKIKKNNRRSFLLMIAVFTLPILLAKLALDGDWLATGVTNKGTLLTNELTLEKLGVDNLNIDKQWIVLYNLPMICDEFCQHSLETVHNTYVALGKDMPRVTPVAMFQRELSTAQLEQISKSQWQLINLPEKAKSIINESQVLIVDPLGNVIMSHRAPNDPKELSNFGKQILSDMKKLLKYSKVG